MFRKKTVASVMSAFQQVVTDLKTVASEHLMEAEKSSAKIEKLLDEVEGHEADIAANRAEAQTALNLADKFKADYNLS
jgi:prephenate dehydratase